VTLNPFFNPMGLAWLERGGVFAVAHVHLHIREIEPKRRDAIGRCTVHPVARRAR
jgi:hypothetical protein